MQKFDILFHPQQFHHIQYLTCIQIYLLYCQIHPYYEQIYLYIQISTPKCNSLTYFLSSKVSPYPIFDILYTNISLIQPNIAKCIQIYLQYMQVSHCHQPYLKFSTLSTCQSERQQAENPNHKCVQRYLIAAFINNKRTSGVLTLES